MVVVDFYFTDRKFNLIEIASTDGQAPYQLSVAADLESINAGARTLSGTLVFTKEQANRINQMAALGNYVLYHDKFGNDRFMTIMDIRHDPLNGTHDFTAEDAGVDLINETVGAYTADKAYNIAYYINKFTYDSGFKIGTNEISTLSRKLKWDSTDETSLARILSVATQFDAELDFSFEISGTNVVKRYINIYKHRGADNQVRLYLDKDINNIVTTGDIYDLYTSVYATGGTPEGSDKPITLKGYKWTDPDGRYELGADGILRDTVAVQLWSRILSNDNPNPTKHHLQRSKSYEASTQASLLQSALGGLKKAVNPAVNYEVDIAVLPENIEIGDTVHIVDDNEDLYLSARVLELKYDYALEQYTATLGDYLIEHDQVSSDLRELADQVKNMPKVVQYYPWVRYADDADGNGFSMFPQDKAYMAVVFGKTSIPSENVADYAGKWQKTLGNDGQDGIEGPKGADGKTPYFHIAYANSADGTDGFYVGGGTNLLINTSSSSANGQTVMQGASAKIFGVYSRTDSYEQVTAPSSGEFYYRFMYPDANKLYGLAPGETYTLSGSASLTSGTLQARTQYHNGSGWIDLDYLTDLGIPVSDGSVFKPFLYTFTVPVGATGIYFSLQNNDYTDGSLFRFKNMKLEKGSEAHPKYMGTYTDFTQADSLDPTAYSWTQVKGDDGKDGVDGKDGLGIKSTAIAYQLSSSGTTTPTGTWSNTVPALTKGQYLWTRTTLTYTDNSSEPVYSVSYVAKDGNNGSDGIAGKDGVGIKTTTITYATSTSGTSAPTSGWVSTPPTATAGQFVWTRTIWIYTDNTTETGYSVGKIGEKGATGSTGATGPQGPQGPKGDPGSKDVPVITSGTTYPSNPKSGDMHWMTNSAGVVTGYYKFDGSQWVVQKIDAQSLNVSSLSALSADLGTVTTGIITGSNLSINLNTGEIMFTKGSIKSTNGKLNINVDDGTFAQTDTDGSGVHFEHGGMYLGDKSFLWSDSDTYYGFIRAMFSLDGDDQKNPAMYIQAKNGLSIGTENSVNIAGSRGSGSKYTAKKAVLFSEGMSVVTGGDSFLSADARIGVSGKYPGGGSDWTINDSTPGTSVYLRGSSLIFNAAPGSNASSNFAVATDANGYLLSMTTYKRTYSSGANMTVTANGVFGRISSASKYKLDISTVSNITEQAHAFLAVEPKQWFDKAETEDMAKELTEGDSGSVDSANVRPYYGYVAEDLYSAGLDNVVLRDSNTGELEGIQYDRLTIYHHELIRELYQRVNDLEAKIYSMEANK